MKHIFLSIILITSGAIFAMDAMDNDTTISHSLARVTKAIKIKNRIKMQKNGVSLKMSKGIANPELMKKELFLFAQELQSYVTRENEEAAYVREHEVSAALSVLKYLQKHTDPAAQDEEQLEKLRQFILR